MNADLRREGPDEKTLSCAGGCRSNITPAVLHTFPDAERFGHAFASAPIISKRYFCGFWTRCHCLVCRAVVVRFYGRQAAGDETVVGLHRVQCVCWRVARAAAV